MFQRILLNGLVAGLVVGIPLFAITVALQGHPESPWGVALGYLIMLVALATVFVAVKRQRDLALGGVIGFWPAFGMGLGISAVASVLYVLAWEATLAWTHMDFAGDYARAMIDRQRARGASPQALARLAADMDSFRAHYAQPAYRMAETFSEIFPVGLLVSLVSAGLLRNSRFMPLRRAG